MTPQPSTLNPQLAALYRRVSTDHQDGSLASQEKRVTDYCAFKGLATHEGLTFSDPDTSGGTPIMDRLGGRAMMNRLQLGDVKHLVIAKLDRLGRNVKDALGILEFLEAKDVTLHITDFGGETISTQGHMGKLILTVLLAVAEWELEEIRDRTRKQMQRIFDAGKLTGNVPFGWDCEYTFADGTTLLSPRALSAEELSGHGGKPVSKFLQPNPGEQETIRLMQQWRASGLKYQQIADELNRRGVTTKIPAGHPVKRNGAVIAHTTGRWQSGHIKSILESKHTARLSADPILEDAA